MKTFNHLLFAAAAILTFNAAASAQTVEPVLSPRAAQLRYELRKVPGTTPDMLDRSIQPGTPRTRDLAYSLRKVPSTGPSIDLAHAPRPTLSPKNPRFEAAWRENAIRQYEVAPLKPSQGKEK